MEERPATTPTTIAQTSSTRTSAGRRGSQAAGVGAARARAWLTMQAADDLASERAAGAPQVQHSGQTQTERRPSAINIDIDIDADLSWFDDEDRNIANVNGATARYKVGDVAIAGRPEFWSWILIDEIDEPWIAFRRIDAREAATHGELVIAAS